MFADARDRCAHRFVDIGVVQSAVGVMHEDHFARLKEPLREDERAQHVLADQPARVAKDVRFSGIEAEYPEVVDPRVHARYDRDVLGRNDGARPFEIGFVHGGVGEEFLGCGVHERVCWRG